MHEQRALWWENNRGESEPIYREGDTLGWRRLLTTDLTPAVRKLMTTESLLPSLEGTQ